MRIVLFLFVAGISLFLLKSCSPEPDEQKLFTSMCGSCHQVVDPSLLPRAIWEKRVLPEMAARMGIRAVDYNPANYLPPGEYELARAHGFYPEMPTVDREDWQTVRQYILDRAPDSLTLPPVGELAPLEGFVARPLSLDDRDGSLVTYIGKGEGGLNVGDGYGQLTRLAVNDRVDTLPGLRFPLVHFTASGTDSLLLEIGNIYPTEASNGKLYRLTDGNPEVVRDSLHRPVHHLQTDIDGDGQKEIVICEYGNYSGVLSILDPDANGDYRYRRLTGTPGATRVVADDLNGDGLRDLILLHAQGDEGIDVLYQQPDHTFERESLLRFPAVYGTSWFDLVDIDGDGDRDIITAHGDNADYSNITKPYHGVRIYTNDGSNQFTESFFQPLPGATRVAARDFDGDGDVDIAVACNFADFGRQPDASFVYLERRSPTLSFRAATTPMALDGRWLILDTGDYDDDGDVDIALGSFTLNPAPVPDTLARRWRQSRTDVLLLENTLEATR
ncbi:FG-GAP repeat domain-containing protein [Lewinella sp. IMCC34191]|uniref:FG-GAP repeat domain-containing protein n=1 Tax=Lewinella sp. IMCC34191 TaxID=2259172 RepID=UPI0018E516B3|nr:VCBS repeat-containing protein [Lewinella sp. IMCC34191]